MASSQQLSVDGHAPEAELHAAIRAACRSLLPGWAGLSDEDMAVSFMTGGISNALLKVDPAGAPTAGPAGADSGGSAAPALQPVAFRIYGDNTENFIDREKELGIMREAHKHGFGPEVLATFSNGRIEEFLPMRSLQPEEMGSPECVPAIAATLRRFHDMPAPGERTGRTPFRRIYEWLDVAEKFVFHDPKKQQLFAAEFDFAAMRAEVAAVEAAASALHSPLVFSHNDLLSGNVMVQLASNSDAAAAAPPAAAAANSSRHSSMTFIDFEYADWAPRGYDWGNHFCEYAGFECDYSRYPDQQQAAQFIQHYLAAGSGSDAAAAQDKEAVARCVVEANVYALAAHQYWGTWSLLQAKWSSIDFDYLSYAQLRWGEYRRRKDEFLAAAAAAAAPAAAAAAAPAAAVQQQ